MKKTSQADRQQRMRQIFCLILAILMLLGTLAAVIPYVSAADLTTEDIGTAYIPVMTEDAINEEEPDNGLLLRIGLMFGSGVTESFATSTESGFVFSHVTSDNTVTPLYELPEPYIAVCKDANLAVDENGIYVPSAKNVVIGGYHLELPTVYKTAAELTNAVTAVNDKLRNAGIYSSLIYAFPAYRTGALVIRIGDFGSGDSARAKIASVSAAVGETPTPVFPRDTAMTVIVPDRNLILFEYEEANGLLGLTPLQPKTADATSTENVTVTPAKNGYQGTFLYGRYGAGISVTNLIPLEQYIAGVIPYEINNTWSYESLKAFACITRSYTLANRGKHTSYAIDLCNGTDCQVYMGTGRQNDAILRAVDETRGTVITYNDKICNTFYSAVTGGCTVNVEQIWNGTSYPYLRAVETPWEDYASHSRGIWLMEVSPYELYQYLAVTKGYTKLTGPIADVSITELAENSTYVYKLTITDVNGNKLDLKGTDIVRTTLGRYLNSANFVVGYKGDIPILNKALSMLTATGETEIAVTKTDAKTTTTIMTADGAKEIDITNGMTVKTGDDAVTTLSEINRDYDIPENAKERLADETNENFLFIGKGWGHGGGISQWGAKNLAEQGAFYDEIINAYFTDIELRDYRTLPAFAEESTDA